MTDVTMPGCRVHLDAPRVVGRAAGHHWFSTVHVLSEEWVLCPVVLTADKAQGKWPARVYLSEDGGSTWGHGIDIDSYGPASVPKSPHQLLLMPYELWPARPGDRRNAVADGSLITWRRGTGISVESKPVRFNGFPRDLNDYHDNELCLLTNGNVLSLADGRLFTTLYGCFDGASKYDCVAVASEDGGWTWGYLADVARWQEVPEGPEGPDESNSARLPDGSLMCVYRVGSGRPHRYHHSRSTDEGRTWSRPAPLPEQWSVEPQLVCLANGSLLLSGGRPGLLVWACLDGRGEVWHAVDLAAHHNRSVDDTSLHFGPECAGGGSEGTPAYTTSYTCMKAVGPDQVLLSYDRLGNGWHGAPGPWGPEDAVFVVRVKVEMAAGI
jgi:hypothetical protein